MPRITSEEVSHLALLCRIAMTEDDVELMRDQMSNILENIDVLNQAPPTGVEPTGHSVDSCPSCATTPLPRQPTGRRACERPAPRGRLHQGQGGAGVMSEPSLTDLTLSQARELLDRREVSSVELTRAALDRIAQVEDSVKAFVRSPKTLRCSRPKRPTGESRQARPRRSLASQCSSRTT